MNDAYSVVGFRVVLALIIGGLVLFLWWSATGKARDARIEKNPSPNNAKVNLRDAGAGLADLGRQVNRGISAINRTVEIAAIKQRALAPIESAVEFERMCVESAHRSAKSEIEFERYMATVSEPERIEHLLSQIFDKVPAPKPTDPHSPPDFAIAIASVNPEAKQEIIERVAYLKSQREAFLSAQFREILADDTLTEHFWKKLDEFGEPLIAANLRIIAEQTGVQARKKPASRPYAETKPLTLPKTSGDPPIVLRNVKPAPSITPRPPVRIVTPTQPGIDIEAMEFQKEISEIIHFTQVENLPSILEHGLCPVSYLQQRKLPFRWNDAHRLDGYEASVSLSINHPNDRLFYHWRKKHPAQKWVVLLIDPCVLYEKSVRFCACNAADSRARHGQLAGNSPSDFSKMFDPRADVPSRESQFLNAGDPTDPQAEVLCFESIEPTLIRGLVFADNTSMREWGGLIGERQVRVDREGTGLFGARSFARRARQTAH